jgi:RNA polymerase sigma-70 factor (family 1)
MMTPVDATGLNNDAFLMTQIAQGNGHAFNLLFRKHWEEAFSMAYKRLKDEEQAKDIVQDIFTHIWVNRATLHINNLPAYLNRAIRNRVIKAVVKQKKVHPFLAVLENITGKECGADAAVLWKEFYRAYENLLNTMPPQRRTIFRLRFDEDLATKDIASMLGLSTKTVQNQLGKAFEKLRMSLAHLWLIIAAIFHTIFS